MSKCNYCDCDLIRAFSGENYCPKCFIFYSVCGSVRGINIDKEGSIYFYCDGDIIFSVGLEFKEIEFICETDSELREFLIKLRENLEFL